MGCVTYQRSALEGGGPMDRERDTSSKSANWGALPRWLLLVAILISMAPHAPKVEAAARVQPALLQMVVQHPDATVRVIVQKASSDRSVEALVTRMGGTVTRDLHIINAFAAEMPARAVQQLAGSSGVRWVSMDAP